MNKILKNKLLILFSVMGLFSVNPSSLMAQSMVLESLTGPVTQNEINAFRTYVQQKVTAPSYNGGNVWVYGNSGKAVEACGLMYEVSKDLGILNRMIYLCDAALAGRNDRASAANGGQLPTWTGNIDPIWPSTAEGVTPAGAGVEQGQVLSHIAYCAQLILQTPSIWNMEVSTGDPNGYGLTYKARALKYIQDCDFVIDNWILPRFIRTADRNRYYFPSAPNTYKPNDPAPWNQAAMISNAFIRLAQCHDLLGDDPVRVKKYDDIVKPNLDWFFSELVPNTSSFNTACWIWRYAIGGSIEDTNHMAYDVEGLYIAYRSGRFGLTFNDLLPFANTYCDVVLSTVSNGYYAGKVDGTYGTSDHSDGDNYVRDEYLYLIDFRPDYYQIMGNIEISKNKIASSPQITARLLWQKNRRIAAPSGLIATAVSESRIDLSWTDNSSNETSFTVERSADAQNWTTLATLAANETHYTDSDLDASVKYYYRIMVGNALGNAAYSEANSATTLDSSIPPSEPSGLTCTLSIKPSDIQVQLNWVDNSKNESQFRIERSLDGIDWSSVGTVPPNTTIFIDAGLLSSTKYYYRLRAENFAGNSAYTTFSSITTSLPVINIVLNKPATVSNIYSSSYGAEKAVDGNNSTRWATVNGITEATLEVDLQGSYTFLKSVIREYGNRVASYKVQYWDGSSWADAASGTTIGTEKTNDFAAVTGSKVRLSILGVLSGNTAGPTIYEFSVYGYEAAASDLTDPVQHSKAGLWYTTNPAAIGFHLPEATSVILSVYDLKGNEVKTLLNGYEEAGTRILHWDISSVPDGVYFVRMLTSHDKIVSKLIISK